MEWAGHPNWYFRISKFSIPWLRHGSVPRTWFLDEVRSLPLPREQLLLKPLFFTILVVVVSFLHPNFHFDRLLTHQVIQQEPTLHH